MSEQLLIELPGSGAAQTYQMTADAPVRFSFDISEAVFASSGNDLIITVEGGGSVILQDYLALAQEGSLPVFELMNGEHVPGDVYLFAFEDTQLAADAVETAADAAASGSGAGAYSDDPGSLGDALNALGGQGDAYDTTSFAAVPEESVALPAEDGAVIYPENEAVQIVLNPSFEASGFRGDRWTYLNDVDHWKNTGGPEQEQYDGPQYRMSSFHKHSPMETWGPRMPQTPEDGVRHMEIDSIRNSVDELSQAIATQEGEQVAITFNFAPRVGGAVHKLGMETNDFEVTLGEQVVATITWDAEYENGAWLVSLGEGVTTADGSSEDFHFVNNGYVYGGDESRSTDWTELSFNVTADQDHASLTFSELGDHDDSYGTLIDSVTAIRNFHTYTVGESGHEGAEYIQGTDGDDAIFGASRDVVDGTERDFAYADVIDGQDGDDALYGGQNFFNIISGGEGDDFIVAGRPLGIDEGDDNGIGLNLIMPGSGNDYVRMGEGSDSIIINKDAMVDGETILVENFTVGHHYGDGDSQDPLGGILDGSDHIFLADGLSIESQTYDGDLHLFVTDGSNTIEVTLLGVSPASMESFVHTGPESDALNDLVQNIIDSGGSPVA